jgi:hypothetical protein
MRPIVAIAPISILVINHPAILNISIDNTQKMPIWQMNNPLALIQTVPALDSNLVAFPSWQN